MHRYDVPCLLAASLLIAIAIRETPAQAPLAVVRADDAVVAQLDGPARLRDRFRPTDLGSLLAAQESERFWEALELPFGALLEKVGVDARPLLPLLDGYRGRITLGATFRPELDGAIVLAPDSATDLALLATAIGFGLETSELQASHLTFDDEQIACYLTPAGVALTAPRLAEGHLVLLFGAEPSSFVERRLTAPAEGAFVPCAELAQAAFALRVSVAGMLPLLHDDNWLGLDDATTKAVAAELGATAIDELRLLVAPEGPHVVFEHSILFRRGAARGAFAGLFPQVGGGPALAGLAPPEARFWQAGKLRPGIAMLGLVRAAAVVLGPPDMTRDESFDYVRDALAGMFGGVDVEDDLFAHAGDDVLLLGDVFGRGDGDAAGDAPAELGDAGPTGMLVVTLKDADAFRGGLMRYWDAVHGGRDGGDDHRGATVHASADGEARGAAWTVTDGLAAIAWGPDARGWVEALVDRRRALRSADALTRLPQSLQRRRMVAPKGFTGCGEFDVRGLIGAYTADAFDLGLDLDAWLGEGWARTFAELQPLLVGNPLERAVGFSGFDGDRWLYRVAW